jgi:hypothetical protein
MRELCGDDATQCAKLSDEQRWGVKHVGKRGALIGGQRRVVGRIEQLVVRRHHTLARSALELQPARMQQRDRRANLNGKQFMCASVNDAKQAKKTSLTIVVVKLKELLDNAPLLAIFTNKTES